MQAFYISEPGRSEVRSVQQPEPGPDEVLLQTRFIGLCGTDLSTFRGKNPLVSYPRIPGHEIAATIVELGRNVPEPFAPGEAVTLYPNTSCGGCASCRRGRFNACKFNETLGVQRDGALRGYFTMDYRKLVRSAGLPLRTLALVEPLAVGFHATARGRASAGESVAVIGCGMVGLGVTASAAAAGATVIAVDLDDGKLRLAKQAGARHVINSQTQTVHTCLQESTDGHGPDLIVEAVGTPETYRLAVEEVAHTGRVVYIGWTKDPVTFDTKLFVHKELDILGARNYLNEFPAVMNLLGSGAFPVDETISLTVPLESAGEALDRWSRSPQAFTKILVEVNP